MESFQWRYQFKEALKLFSGAYLGGLFNSDYKRSEMLVRDQYFNKNLNYPRSLVPKGTTSFYIGQPLIEDQLISSRHYRQKLTFFFSDKNVVYLPHPREKHKAWLKDIFTVLNINEPAESYILKHGARAIYSAFSTVNLNVHCDNNIYLARHLGLTNIADRIEKFDFGIKVI